MSTSEARAAARAALEKKAEARRTVGAPVVELEDVTKVYDGGHGGLDHASLRIDRGEFGFLDGPTGCGQSTCIRLLMKELEPTSRSEPTAGRDPADVRPQRP